MFNQAKEIIKITGIKHSFYSSLMRLLYTFIFILLENNQRVEIRGMELMKQLYSRKKEKHKHTKFRNIEKE